MLMVLANRLIVLLLFFFITELGSTWLDSRKKFQKKDNVLTS